MVMNKPCKQFYVWFKDFYFEFLLRVRKRFSERFAKNCVNINTQNRQNDVIHSLRVKNHDTSGLRSPFHDRHPSSRHTSAAFLCYITTAYLCARKKNTRADNTLIHARPFDHSCAAPLWCIMRFYVGKCLFKTTAYVENKSCFFFIFKIINDFLWPLIPFRLCFITFHITYPFHMGAILVTPYENCKFRNVIKNGNNNIKTK